MIPIPPIGATLGGHLRIESVVQIAGQSVGLRTRDLSTGGIVFTKLFDQGKDETSRRTIAARAEREASLVLQSPAAVKPIEHIRDGDHLLTTFEWIDGEPLDRYMHRKGGRLPTTEIVRMLPPLVNYLEELETLSIVHRDIKPNNIMIQPDGSPRVIDLGIARLLNAPTISGKDDTLGTLPWMAPEQLRCPPVVDTRADSYALGGTLRYLATGQPLSTADEPRDLVRDVCELIPPPITALDPSFPAELSAAIAQLLAKDPSARIQSVRELMDALNLPTAPQPFCGSCSAGILPGHRFCPRCGAPATQESARTACLACGAGLNGDRSCPGCQRPFGLRDHLFRFDAGPATGLALRIPLGACTVGRDRICKRDGRTSRNHLTVLRAEELVEIEDAGSTNGTLVDGTSVRSRIALRPHQTIVVGSNIITYLTKETSDDHHV